MVNPKLGLIYDKTLFDVKFGGLGGICDSFPAVGVGPFTLRDEIINKSSKIMRSGYFTKHQKADIREIGLSMMPFIQEDLEFIRLGRYHVPFFKFLKKVKFKNI